MNTLTEEKLNELEGLLIIATTSKGYFGERLAARENVSYLAMFHLPALISMARRTLEVEERLEKAVEAIEDAMMHLRTNIDIDGNKMDESDAFRSLDRFLSAYLDGPEAIRPPQECAPPEVTDVVPDEEPEEEDGPWAEGWQERMRKGLDDHSCNSTGWEKV